MSGEFAASGAVAKRLIPHSVRICARRIRVYSDPTNQVPATWFASDAGIRRLASLSDGPERGRRRVFTLGGFSDVSFSVCGGPETARLLPLVGGGSQLGGPTQQPGCGPQRTLGFHQCTRNVVVLAQLEARHVVAHFVHVTVDVVGHHGQGHGGVGGHVAQSAAHRAANTPRVCGWRVGNVAG